MRTIVITNMKGGVSKTTTALSLAKGMADKGYKTLLIDSDPQANATDVAGNIGNELDEKFINEFNDDIKNEEDFLNKLNDCLYSDYTINFNLKDIFEEPSYIKEVIMKTRIKNLDLIPSAL